MSEKYLFEILEALDDAGTLSEVPDYIGHGLSSKIGLREYQELAFSYFITYSGNTKLKKNKQLHNLFHMATGSGKTVIMAGLILYFYQQGYRKFLFFVNQTNIIEKTKENFLKSNSNKYLFANPLNIYGKNVRIQEVQNFSVIDQTAINICFTTTQKLHYDLTFPKENCLTFDDFENDGVVLISDESHHINSWTKRLTKDEDEEEKSWEYSVDKIYKANKDNCLIEFTATCDMKDPNVSSKYIDKIIFDYPLAKFRAMGFTKEFKNMQTDYSSWERTLIALIISEYRKNLFADAKQNIKPVVLLKSQRIIESQEFYSAFFERLNELKPSDLYEFLDDNNEILNPIFGYFKEKDETLGSLVQSLKFSFSKEKSIIMNGSTDNTIEKQLAVNSLEDPENPYRIIFTVDMLNEGWDVLNLYDIVRLYETRQASSKSGVGSYTTKEAQLIGRGARYCPFQVEEGQDRHKRKYDFDLDNENRMLETLLYHSKQDSRYIAELRKALKETGLLPNNPIEIEYILKESFRATDFFQNGVIFSNRKLLKNSSVVSSIDKRMQNAIYTKNVSFGKSSVYELFNDVESSTSTSEIYNSKLVLKDIPLSILLGSIEQFDGLRFDQLKKKLPNLGSIREFLLSPDYIGNSLLIIQSNQEVARTKDVFDICTQTFKEIAKYVVNLKSEYYGSEEFYPKEVKNVLKNKKIFIDNPHGDGVGISQKLVRNELAMDLIHEDWYIYNDNFGTTEEKAFLKYFSSWIPELKNKYSEVYLIRNERISDLAIFDFNSAERFEPDFLLIMQKTVGEGYDSEQIYIEPKGDPFIEDESWKERFLKKIEEKSIPIKIYADDNNYRIFGLPFFNINYRTAEFSESLKRFAN